jgi:hypothetical protein
MSEVFITCIMLNTSLTHETRPVQLRHPQIQKLWTGDRVQLPICVRSCHNSKVVMNVPYEYSSFSVEFCRKDNIYFTRDLEHNHP